MKNIYVTRPFLPPLSEFLPRLEEVWNSGILTNCGPQHQQLEEALKKYLDVRNIALVNNGTTALQAALEILDIQGEVITTPYSFVATSHSLVWRKCKPVFVDICAGDCNIDPAKVAEAVNERTSAILAVHCYGFPCDVEALQAIAEKNNLKLIYDAAHAFGVKYKNKSVLNYGDISTLSFHATKIFNTMEGGAVVCAASQNDTRARKIRNFGFDNEISVSSIGLNFKLNEIQAIIGLAQLPHMGEILAKRKAVASMYDAELSEVEGIVFPRARMESLVNHSYYPILIDRGSKRKRDDLYAFLKKSGIHSRRYFYPLISDFVNYKKSSKGETLPVARYVSERIVCLPIYPDLSEGEQYFVIGKIKDFFGR